MKDEDGQRCCEGGTQSRDRRNSAQRAAANRFGRYAKGDRHEAGEAEGRQQLGLRRRLQQEVGRVGQERDNGRQQVELPGAEVLKGDLAQQPLNRPDDEGKQ